MTEVLVFWGTYVELAGVFTSIVVGVPNERSLPVVFELVPADSDPVRSVGDVKKSIEIILSTTI